MTKLAQLRRGLAGLLHARAGSIAVEFALCLPVLLLMALGTFEVGRYILLHERLNRVAFSAADLTARASELADGDIADIFAAVDIVFQPFRLAEESRVILSSASHEDDETRIDWQRRGGGDYDADSRIGEAGASPSLPGSFELGDGDGIVIAEAFFDYEPFLAGFLLPPRTLYAVAQQRPRVAAIKEID